MTLLKIVLAALIELALSYFGKVQRDQDLVERVIREKADAARKRMEAVDDSNPTAAKRLRDGTF